MKILIDADACPRPVLEICLRLGKKYAVPVWTVASINHNIMSDNHIIVDNQSQQADIRLINMTSLGDIVITQDWGLAAMVLGKKARCLSPMGREYSAGNIEFLLEEREAKARVRRGGGRTKGPKGRTEQDDRCFEASLQRIIHDNK